MGYKQCRKVDGSVVPSSFIRQFLVFIFLSITAISKSETVYPIDLYAAMLPPYTNCIGDYINGDQNRLKLTAVVRDLTKQSGNLSISVSIKVKSGNTVYLESSTPIQQIVNLQGAMTVINTHKIFTSADLNAKGRYKDNGYCLPEGAYEFVYQVFDGYNKTLPLSAPISVYCYLNQAEPPIGIFPQNGDCINEMPVINFQWIDAIATSPQYKAYQFEIYESMADMAGEKSMFGANCEDARTCISKENVYYSNIYPFQNTSAKLQKDKTYYWRVKAIPNHSVNQKDGNFAYKNGGYSEWNSFTYGCSPIEIKEKTNEVWETDDDDDPIFDDDCYTNMDQADCYELIQYLNPGDSFIANDEDMVVTVTESTKNGDGSFSGKGNVSCTLLKKKLGLNVTFDHIFVNQGDELCKGTVRVVTSAQDNLLLSLNKIAQKDYASEKATCQENAYTAHVKDIKEIEKNPSRYSGQIVLVGDDEIVAVDRNGEIVSVGTVVDNACSPATQSLDNEYGTISFDVADYNGVKYEPYIDKYVGEFINCPQVAQGYDHLNSYTVPWLAMVEGEARWIKATIDSKSKSQKS